MKQWLTEHLDEIQKIFGIYVDIPKDFENYSAFITVFDSVEDFNNPKHWEGTPFEDYSDVYAEMKDKDLVEEIDGKYVFFDSNIYNLYFNYLCQEGTKY